MKDDNDFIELTKAVFNATYQFYGLEKVNAVIKELNESIIFKSNCEEDKRYEVFEKIVQEKLNTYSNGDFKENISKNK